MSIEVKKYFKNYGAQKAFGFCFIFSSKEGEIVGFSWAEWCWKIDIDEILTTYITPILELAIYGKRK
jgi:hypothetical protein